MGKVYTCYCGTSEIEHGLCACTVDNPQAKARGLSLRTGAQTMLYLSLVTEQFVLLCQDCTERKCVFFIYDLIVSTVKINISLFMQYV